MIPIKPSDVTWTDEQWTAIYEDNKNIIVSAGAGSGKTAVLTERVIRKLKDGVNINELLILTFTKAAAAEMEDRIRKKIKKIKELKEQLNLLDASYITTFDSFALSVVKRYHYLLNISPSVKIIDSNVIEIKKQEIMEEIFLEYYSKEDELFLKLIKNMCTKDDSELRKYILSISNKLDLLSNKKKYLEEYLYKYFNEDKIKNDIKIYTNLILDKIKNIKNLVLEISHYDGDFSVLLDNALVNLYNVDNYDDLIKNLNISLPRAPRGSDEELKSLKSNIGDIIKEIKKQAVYSDELEIINSIKSTKDTILVIINIILEFTKRVDNYKKMNNCYEFNDIAIMAIKVVRDNDIVREELRTSFNEIMIDEYQDTNDLQEEFISLISHDNVYMVGDIKQSIYRFRNANPYIFKNKYDNYSISKKDKKIDLNKNFRSRNEVLDNINNIFTLIMSDEIGGADYLTTHQMIFGNKAYLKDDIGHSNDMEVYNYLYDKELGFTKEEIEAFIVGDDIKKKINDNYLVMDKESNTLRKACYGDFAIIMDRSTDFDLYKKIFNYLKVPINLLKDEKMNDEDDIWVLNNLIRFIILVKKKDFTTEFKYLFTSIMRSFLYSTSDEAIFDYFKNNNFSNSKLYQQALELANNIDSITIHELLDLIIIKFNYYEKLLTIGDIHKSIVKVSKLRELCFNLEELGYDIYSFSDYFKKLLKDTYKMEYKVPDNGEDAVKIMTIHKSKGLEYPVCYFSGLYKKFNISDLKEKILFDKKYGMIVPYFDEGIGNTIYKDLVKQNYLKEEISEKIRLFYVAMTRAREKMIVVSPVNLSEDNTNRVTVLDDSIKFMYRSLADMINSIQFSIHSKYKKIDLDNILLSKDYLKIKKTNFRQQLEPNHEKIKVLELNLDNEVKKNLTFSKKMTDLINKNTYSAIKLGTKIHEYLEFIDFKNPNLEVIEDKFIKGLIEKLLKSSIMEKVMDATIYQEYEFIYEDNLEEYHGVIDLMLEYDDYIDIIDYKLKNITDDNYKKQLMGYKNYIELKTNKKINLYLYSILDSEVINIK